MEKYLNFPVLIQILCENKTQFAVRHFILSQFGRMDMGICSDCPSGRELYVWFYQQKKNNVKLK